MDLTISRHKRDAAPAPPARPRYLTEESHGHTDLCCAICGRRIAFAVTPERLDELVAMLASHAVIERAA